MFDTVKTFSFTTSRCVCVSVSVSLCVCMSVCVASEITEVKLAAYVCGSGGRWT